MSRSIPFAVLELSIRFTAQVARYTAATNCPFWNKYRKWPHNASKIAFQGELGAYGHQACAQARPDFEPLPCETFDDAIESVRKGDADLGMIAVENSTYGRVADVHSLLPESGLHIVDESFVRVHVNLLAKKVQYFNRFAMPTGIR